MKPALYAYNEQEKLPLDVGPTVIKNHLKPQDVAFNATVMNYVGTQAAIGTLEEQYIVLLLQMDNLVNIYDSAADWEKIEMPRGTYMAGSRLNRQLKDEQTCYHWKRPGHNRTKYPDLKKKKGSSETKQSDAKKKWYNTNKDNKTTMTRDGKDISLVRTVLLRARKMD